MHFPYRIFMGICVLFVAMTSAHAGPSKEFRDWYVWCDDVFKCAMQTSNDDELYAFGFERGPKANSEAVLFLSMGHKPKEGSKLIAILDGNQAEPFTFHFDKGVNTDGSWQFPGQNLQNFLLNGMMAGNTLELIVDTDEGGKSFNVSLSGVSASALFMDEAQERIGNRDALKAKGEGAPKDMVTQVTILKSSSDLPPEVLDFWKNNTDYCGEGRDDEDDLIKSFGGISVLREKTSRMFLIPCGLPGAYNLVQIVLFYEEKEKRVRIAPLPTMGHVGPSILDNVINGSWDDRKSELSAFYKGRGLGDCGLRTVWKWEGGYYINLELTELYQKDDCDGKYDDWLQIWPPQ